MERKRKWLALASSGEYMTNEGRKLTRKQFKKIVRWYTRPAYLVYIIPYRLAVRQGHIGGLG